MLCLQCGLIEAKTKFCGNSCAAKYYNSRRVKKSHKCGMCENIITGSANKYCSKECHQKSKPKELRKQLFEKFGPKCWKCGWDKINPVTNKCPLVMNHIDGNSENNSDENLELICPNCDSLTPTYKALNKGNGRHSRMVRYREGKSF